MTKELGLFSLKRKRMKDNLIVVFNYLLVGYRKDKHKPFSDEGQDPMDTSCRTKNPI